MRSCTDHMEGYRQHGLHSIIENFPLNSSPSCHGILSHSYIGAIAPSVRAFRLGKGESGAFLLQEQAGTVPATVGRTEVVILPGKRREGVHSHCPR